MNKKQQTTITFLLISTIFLGFFIAFGFATESTFGKTDIGGTKQAWQPGTTELRGCKFILNEAGSVTKVSWYGCNYNSGQINYINAAVYSDDAGTPDALLGQTETTTINSDTPQWWDFTFSSPVSLSAGTYWLAIHDLASSQDKQFYYYWDSGSANQWCRLTNYAGTPSDDFPNPFGSPDTYWNREISLYATYTPEAATTSINIFSQIPLQLTPEIEKAVSFTTFHALPIHITLENGYFPPTEWTEGDINDAYIIGGIVASFLVGCIAFAVFYGRRNNDYE